MLLEMDDISNEHISLSPCTNRWGEVGNATSWDVCLTPPPDRTGPAGCPVAALSPAEAGPWHKEACRSPGAPGEEAEGKQWMAKAFSEKTSAHKSCEMSL